MANKDENILEIARRAGLARPDAGMSVPSGYFEAFAERMSAQLPERPELLEQQPAPTLRRSFWGAVKPYVYMAAMFAGAWCLLNLFSIAGGKGELKPMDSNPVLASALAHDDFVYDYVLPDVSTSDIVDGLITDGLITDDFDMADFSESLSSDYQSDYPSDQILPQ